LLEHAGDAINEGGGGIVGDKALAEFLRD